MSGDGVLVSEGEQINVETKVGNLMEKVDKGEKGSQVSKWMEDLDRDFQGLHKNPNLDSEGVERWVRSYVKTSEMTEAYKALKKKTMTEEELKMVEVVDIVLSKDKQKLTKVVQGSSQYQRRRLRSLGVSDGAAEKEAKHVWMVESGVGGAVSEGKASSLAWWAAVEHDRYKFVRGADGRPVSAVGPHDVLGAIVAEEDTFLMLTEVYRVGEAEAKAAAKYVKLLVAGHGRKEFPIQEGRRLGITVEKDETYMLWGWPVYEMEGMKFGSEKMRNDAEVLRGTDMAVGALRESFKKYHYGTPTEVFYGKLHAPVSYGDKSWGMTVVDSFGASYCNNLLDFDDVEIGRYLAGKNRNELLKAAILLDVVRLHMTGGLEKSEYGELFGEEEWKGVKELMGKMDGKFGEGVKASGLERGRIKEEHAHMFEELVGKVDKVNLNEGEDLKKIENILGKGLALSQRARFGEALGLMGIKAGGED